MNKKYLMFALGTVFVFSACSIKKEDSGTSDGDEKNQEQKNNSELGFDFDGKWSGGVAGDQLVEFDFKDDDTLILYQDFENGDWSGNFEVEANYSLGKSESDEDVYLLNIGETEILSESVERKANLSGNWSGENKYKNLYQVVFDDSGKVSLDVEFTDENSENGFEIRAEGDYETLAHLNNGLRLRISNLSSNENFYGETFGPELSRSILNQYLSYFGEQTDVIVSDGKMSILSSSGHDPLELTDSDYSSSENVFYESFLKDELENKTIELEIVDDKTVKFGGYANFYSLELKKEN